MSKKENRLTHNEMIILKFRAGGCDYNMIANHLKLSKDMVQESQENALKKLEASLNGRSKD